MMNAHLEIEAKNRAIQKLKDIRADQIANEDLEREHSQADEVLCEFLEALGHGYVVALWHDIEKWYA